MAVSVGALISRSSTEATSGAIEKIQTLSEAVEAGKEFDELIEKIDLSKNSLRVSSEAIVNSYKIRDRLFAVLHEIEKFDRSASPLSAALNENANARSMEPQSFSLLLWTFIQNLCRQEVALKAIQEEVAGFKTGSMRKYMDFRPASRERSKSF